VATGPADCVRGTAPPFATHSAPAPAARSVGVAPVAKVVTPASRDHPRDRLAVDVERPDRSRADRDRARRDPHAHAALPAGNGPPAHRHDFDEMFHVLEGEIEVTYRGQTSHVRAGQTANVPANAPHAFRNAGDQTVRLLCMVSPAGLEEYFAEVGDAVQSRTSPAPELDEAEAAARMRKAQGLAAKYRVEVVPPSRPRPTD